MPDATLLPAVVSALGGVIGALSALSGVALTNRAAARKEEREARRRREEQRQQQRDEAYANLLGGARKLRLQIEVAAHRPWEDMNQRLAAIETQAALLGDLAARVAVLSPGRAATAARMLADATYEQASRAARATKVTYDVDGQFLKGEMVGPLAFDELDASWEAFNQVTSAQKPSDRKALDPPLKS
ncbi:hypothetical protein GCM10017673_12480 [Streptosporangium violaceochromogenes]|nr:hypothetical protein GCM10017673_12480 [Streptosporangium violaceochromogenes]